MSEIAVIQPSSVLSVIERAATDPSIDIEKMERLLAMHERLSNLPPGTSENDPSAPWNEKEAKTATYLVELRIRVTAINDDDARQQAGELLETAGVRWADYDIEMAYEEP